MTNQIIKAVMFDLDGTLLDTAPEFISALNQMREDKGLTALPIDTIRNEVSNGSFALIKLGFNLAEDHPEFEAYRQELLARYESIIGTNSPFFTGIDELLSRLDERSIPWGIATNKPAYYTELLLKNLQLDSTPICVICPDHVAERKPHPESLFLAASIIQCETSEIIYIGDHKRDIDCGKDAGAVTIAAGFGYIGEEDLNLWQADHIVQCGTDIWPIIEPMLT